VGADLLRAGHDVTFIDQWPAHVEAIRAHGIRIDIEEEGTFTTPVDRALHLCDVATLTEPFDIVFMVLKAYDTRWGCELIKPYVTPDGVVVGVQNGMTLDSIADVMGSNRAIGAVIEISSTMFDPGVVDRQSPHARSWFALGTPDGTETSVLRDVADLLGCAGHVEVVDDIRSAKWMKLVINAAELVPSAIVDLSIPQAARLPGMFELMVAAGTEALDAGAALGHRIVPILGLEEVDPGRPTEYVHSLIGKLLEDYVLDHTLSTVLQDWRRGRHSEFAEINGAVVDAIGQGRAPVNAAVVELADRIERGELQPDPTNVELLGALASESG
jgi:2-dehydropantoate 2-reductase